MPLRANRLGSLKVSASTEATKYFAPVIAQKRLPPSCCRIVWAVVIWLSCLLLCRYGYCKTTTGQCQSVFVIRNHPSRDASHASLNCWKKRRQRSRIAAPQGASANATTSRQSLG